MSTTISFGNLTIDDIKYDIELRQKVFPINESYPVDFADSFELFIDALITADKALNTISSYYFDLKLFFEFLCEKYKRVETLDNIKPLHVSKFYKYAQSLRKNGKAALRRKKIVLRTFFDFAVEQGYIQESENPIPKEGVIKTKTKKETKLPVFLELDEASRFFKAIMQEENDFIKYRDICLFYLMFKTGLRLSEARGLNVEDIEYIKKHEIIEIVGKGNKSRSIPLLKKEFENGYLSFIDKYLDLRKKYALPDEDALFVSTRKQRISKRQIQKLVKKYKTIAGLDKNVTPHKLRHSFATHLAKRKAPLRMIQELMGHESPETTKIYTHINKEDLKKTIEDYSPELHI